MDAKGLIWAVTEHHVHAAAARQARECMHQAIAEARRDGVPQREIVRLTGYTRERVRQICKAADLPAPIGES